jgi:predicted RNA binding protein YcfA (HicA-like mRNA interferase family)
MKLPRDLSGEELAKRLRQYGYAITRQSGSHLRLTTQTQGQHHITIPAHPALKVGTLNGILGDVATHLGRDKADIATELFG